MALNNFWDIFTPITKTEDEQAMKARGIAGDSAEFAEKAYWDADEPAQIAAGSNLIEPDKAAPLAQSVTAAKQAGQQGGIGVVPAIFAGLAGAFSDDGVETTRSLMEEWSPGARDAKAVDRATKEAELMGKTGELRDKATMRQRDLDMQDKDSDISVRARDFFTKNIPGANVEGLSAADLKSMMPDYWNAAKLEQQGQYSKDQLELQRIKQKRDEDKADATLQEKKDARAVKEKQFASQGEKTTDQAFGKEYNEWTSGGRSSYGKERGNLRSALKELQDADTDAFDATSGAISGRLPDWLRSERAREIQQKVESAAVGMLRATLGSAFTEKEGERIMKLSYDPTMEPAANIRKVQAAIAEMEGRKEALESKSEYWEKDKTLTGWSEKSQPQEETKTIGDKTYVKRNGTWFEQ